MIVVEFHTATSATVIVRPPVIARILFGRRSDDRCVQREVAGLWSYADSGKLVPADVQDAIDRERHLVRAAASKPQRPTTTRGRISKRRTAPSDGGAR